MIALGWAAGAAAPALASPSALSLMRRSDRRHEVAAERVEITMRLQEKGRAARTRRLSMLTAQRGAGDRLRLRFEAPASIAGTALLSVEDPRGGGGDQWLYLPAFRKTRRIGTAELGDRFMGTDLFYEDMKRREVDDFSYRLLRQESLGGHDCWVIESRPKTPRVIKESPYERSEVWLRKDILFAVQVRHYARGGRPLKLIRAEGLKRVRGRAWRADRVTVTDVKRMHRTVLIITRRTTGLKLTDDAFSKHRLAR